MILICNICAATLFPTPAQDFSSMLTLLLYPDKGTKSVTHTALPDKGFVYFQDILCFINGCKWFLVSLFDPTYYSSTVVFQGMSLLEDQMTASNMASHW